MNKFILIIPFIISLLACELPNSKEASLFVIAGQSNAMGVGDHTKSNFENNFSFEFDSKLNNIKPLKDPVGQNHLNFSEAKTGSFIPSFAYHYSLNTQKNCFIVQCAKGGSALNEVAETNNWGNWGPNGELLGHSFTKIDLAIAKTKLPVKAIIWSQGENDGTAIGVGRLTKEAYEISLIELIQKYRLKYGNNLPFIIIETGRHFNCSKCDDGFEIVRDVQRKVANHMEGVYIGYNKTENFSQEDQMVDAVHYNQQSLNDIGEKLAQFLLKVRL